MSSVPDSAVPAAAAASQSAPARPLLMIPGPIEFHPDVLKKMGEPTPGHLAAGFIEEFGSSLELLRSVLGAAADAQPFILSGSGTLGWEVVAANLTEARPDSETGADVLVANTGYFSDSWADCFQAFGIKVAQLPSPELGGTISPEALSDALKANPTVRLVALTHVDTSTGVRNDIAALAAAARQVNPSVLVAVDGVCSFGGEVFKQEEWGVDAAITCSQKAIGVPPGLCLVTMSARAMKGVTERKSRIPSYYANLRNWLPIMRAYEERRPSYFATPAVNLIRALRVSLGQLQQQGMQARWDMHKKASDAFKAAVQALGLKQVPTSATHSAHTLSAVYYPTDEGVDSSKFLPSMLSSGVVLAGGLHKDVRALYFRVGHMGVSVTENNAAHVEKVVAALETALQATGYKFEQGVGIKAFQQVMKA